MNNEVLRQKNSSLILKYVNNNGASSRKDIAEATGLTPASVTQITTSLIKEGILREVGVSTDNTGNPGRHKVYLDINSKMFLTYTVNLEPDFTTIAICDLMGNLMNDSSNNTLIKRITTDNKKLPIDFLSSICSICLELKSMLPMKYRNRIENLSFTITGAVDRKNGISIHAYGIWNEEVNIQRTVESKLSVPVILENNVDAFAIAELFFGTGKKYDDLLVIKWGPGVGSSVIIDGDMYRGRHEKTAELGHVIVNPNGVLCACGRRGCLETIVSEKAMSDKTCEIDTKTAIDIFARAIVNAGTILVPNRIVLFGNMIKREELIDELIGACQSYDPSFGERRIVRTSLSSKEHYIGPASLYTMKKLLCK